jgi:hypothetical protein
MKNIFLFFTLVMSFDCQARETQAQSLKIAAPESQLQFYFVNPELRYERSNAQDLVDRKPKNFAIAYKERENSFLVEYSQFEEQSGNVTASVIRSYQDFTISYRNHFLESQANNLTYSIYWGAGAGFYQEEVATSLLGLTRADKSDARPLGTLSFGTDLRYGLSKSIQLALAAEGRSFVATDFEPNPIWSAVVRFGLVVRY